MNRLEHKVDHLTDFPQKADLATTKDVEIEGPTLSDENINVRFQEAINLWLETGSISQLRESKFVEGLILALKQDDSFVWEKIDDRELIGLLLMEITGQEFGKDVEKWQKWWDENKEFF